MIRSRRRTLLQRLSLVAATLLGVMSPRGAQSVQPTYLGVMSAGGLLTPIAVYDGASWWNRWPWDTGGGEESRGRAIPDSLLSIPADWLPPGLKLPRDWRAFAEGKRFVPFRALRPERSPETDLMETVVITTTYRGPASEATNGGGDTLALSGPGTLGRFLAPSRREADAILRQLQSRIAALEADEIARWKKDAKDAFYAGITLERLYAIDDAGAMRYVTTRPRDYRDLGVLKAAAPAGALTTYYLGGEKLFQLRPNEECMMNLSVKGFVFVSATGKVVSDRIGLSAFAGYCGDPAEMLFPLNTITIGTRTWWIVKNSLEDGYGYGLIDPSTGEPVEIKG